MIDVWRSVASRMDADAAVAALLLSTYLHELGHMYGPDASSRFSHLLTEIACESIRHAEEMRQFLERWDALCCALAGDGRELTGP